MLRAIRLGALTFILTVAALAQSKPNFGGTWKLNLNASDFGPLAGAAPASLVYALKLDGATALHFKLQRTANGAVGGFEINLKVGGPGVPVPSGDRWSVKWEGKSLVFTVDNGKNPSPQIQTWSLSPDGKTMTDKTVVTPPNGGDPFQIRRVFDRQQ